MEHEPRACHVWIRQPIFGSHVVSLDDFMSFPVHLRARLIADGATHFFRSSGTAVPLRETLEAIVTSWAAEFGAIKEPPSVDETGPEDECCGQTGMGGERRRFARTSMIRPVRVLLASTARERFAISEDVSPAGLRFRARGEFSPGDRVVVQWSTSDNDTEETSYEATVVRAVRDRATAATLFPRRVAVVFDGGTAGPR